MPYIEEFTIPNDSTSYTKTTTGCKSPSGLASASPTSDPSPSRSLTGPLHHAFGRQGRLRDVLGPQLGAVARPFGAGLGEDDRGQMGQKPIHRNQFRRATAGPSATRSPSGTASSRRERAGARPSQPFEVRAAPETLSEVVGQRPDVEAARAHESHLGQAVSVAAQLDLGDADLDGLDVDRLPLARELVGRRAANFLRGEGRRRLQVSSGEGRHRLGHRRLCQGGDRGEARASRLGRRRHWRHFRRRRSRSPPRSESSRRIPCRRRS